MTGILKVDQWKDSGDNTLMTSDGAGNLTANAAFSGTLNAGIISINNASTQGRLNVSNNGAEQLEVFPGDASNKVTLQAFNRSTSTSNSFRYFALTHEFTTSGSERMRIDSSGNVGIGTSSPDGSSFSASSSPVLDVSGTRPLIILSETDSNTKKAWLGLSSDQFFVGGTNTDTLFYTDNAERMRIKSDGKLMINTTSDLGNSQGVLHVKGKTSNNIARFGAGSNGEEVIFVNQDDTQVGSIMINSSSTSYNTSSDYRLKENVIDLDDATTRVKQLQPKRFNFISEPDTTIDGFLAHEVSSIVPEAIIGTYNEVEVWKENEELPEGVSVGDNKLDDEGNTIPKYQGIDQSKLVPLLTASLQEAITKIEELETRLTALET